MKKSVRPKGIETKSKKKKNFGLLGEIIRKNRIKLGLSLSEIANACSCSVQFVSNIEHGRVSLPWEKVGKLAIILQVPLEEVQTANLSIRSYFQRFSEANGNNNKPNLVKTLVLVAKDERLQTLIVKYQEASIDRFQEKFYHPSIRNARQLGIKMSTFMMRPIS
jgi:transcriptional regulator with XRE-family HTH domain